MPTDIQLLVSLLHFRFVIDIYLIWKAIIARSLVYPIQSAEFHIANTELNTCLKPELEIIELALLKTSMLKFIFLELGDM